MKTCLTCFSLFDPSSSLMPGSPCPISQCEGKIIEVDENILPTIIQLNKKGYLTTASCSGHSWGGSTIITFDPIVHPNTFSYLPRGFKFVSLGGQPKLVKIIPLGAMLDRQRHILQTSLDLLEWSDSLPSAKQLLVYFPLTNGLQPAILSDIIQSKFQITTELNEDTTDDFVADTYTSPNNADLLKSQIEKFANEEGLSVSTDILDA